MTQLGVEVERSTIPVSIELSKDENKLMDPTSYPVRVALQRLDKSEDEPREIVHAKFVVGGDGAFRRFQSSQYSHSSRQALTHGSANNSVLRWMENSLVRMLITWKFQRA
jgi:hypothetical protein